MFLRVENNQAALLDLGLGSGRVRVSSVLGQGQRVEVLTPKTLMEGIRAGIVPKVHGSVGG